MRVGVVVHRARRGLQRRLHPAQVLVLAAASALALGTGLLMLPVSSQGPGGTGLVDAMFHAASALCVTGLTALSTASHWSVFGQVVLLVLIQLGGLGVMTFASLLGIAVGRRLGLRGRQQAAAGVQSVTHDDLQRVLWGVAKITAVCEGSIAAVLLLRWWLGYDEPIGHAAWLAVFHSISSFNNAGFALFDDNLIRFAADPVICLPLAAGVIIGGLGFPVLMQLRAEFRTPRRWTLNTQLVMVATVSLLLVGTLAVTALEWSNPNTLGALDPPARILAGFVQGTMPRTGGFNSIDIGEANPATWLVMDMLMFIGGGSAGTAGGIKVTTVAVLLLLVYTEVRGEAAVQVFGKRLPRSLHRQAITVAVLAVNIVLATTFALMLLDGLSLDRALFEATSAFSTTGLSTGITADLSDASKVILTAVMFAGRLGPITLATAIALRQTRRLYQYPKDRPLIG